jgi:hypothetical protein
VDWRVIDVCLYVLFLRCSGLVGIRRVLVCVAFILQWTGGIRNVLVCVVFMLQWTGRHWTCACMCCFYAAVDWWALDV